MCSRILTDYTPYVIATFAMSRLLPLTCMRMTHFLFLTFWLVLTFLNALSIVFSNFGEKLATLSHINMVISWGSLACFTTTTFNTSYAWFSIDLTVFSMNFSSFSNTIASSQFTTRQSSESSNVPECPAKS